MCRTQCVLALAALYVGLAHSWDIAVSLGDQLIFYTDDGRQTNSLNFMNHNLTKLVYNEVHNMILYVDKQSLNDGICGYNLLSKENKCFIRRVGSNFHDIAFDPVTETVFFTDTNDRSIHSISLKPESNNNVSLVIKMDDYRTPGDIAVDSCRGYIYWTNKNVTGKEYMERARFNGSDREVIHQHQDISTFAVDLQSRKIYIFSYYYSHELMDLMQSQDLVGPNHQNDYTLFEEKYRSSKQKELTVSNDYLYWLISTDENKAVWRVPKNATLGVKAKFSSFDFKSLHGIAANYKIKDQIEGLQDCEVLSLKPTITGTNNSLSIQQTTEYLYILWSVLYLFSAVELLCVHGIKVGETCKCTPGYIGEGCDVSVCEKYCLQGDCSFNDEGLPKCRCNAGYSGTRCEVYACHAYCLNSGVCSLNEDDEPVCQCVGNHEGMRCEGVNDKIPSYDSAKTNLVYKPYIYISRTNNTVVYPMPYTNIKSLGALETLSQRKVELGV